MTAPIDPRIRSWLADPGQAVMAAPDERAVLAVMALREVRAEVPEARLVVLLSDVTGEARWAEALEEVGLSVVRGRVDDTGCDAAVTVFTPEVVMTVLARSPAEVWVDDGVLDGDDRLLAGGAWQLHFTEVPSSPRVGRLAVSPDVRAAQRWLATTLAPRPIAVDHGPGKKAAASLLEVEAGDVRSVGTTFYATDDAC